METELLSEYVLEINHISVCFDGFYALTDVTTKVKRNDIHFFIGPNGAGKTTLVDIICAKTKPTNGNIVFNPMYKKPITLTGVKEYKIVWLGIGRKFQVPSVFVNLTVEENMILSLRKGKRIVDTILRKMRDKEVKKIAETLEKVGLSDKRQWRAGALAHGEKQWLEIAMQLVQEPEVIMLDEPAAGMGKPETFKTGEILKEIKKECTVIVIEHDMDFVKQIANQVTVLHEGKILKEGCVAEVLSDSTVQKVYLGRGGE